MSDDLLCSAWARSRQVDPIGTAGSYAGFLLVEWSPPWPRDVADVPELTDLAAAAKKARIRLQAVAPSSVGGEGRVAFYSWLVERGAFRGTEAPALGKPAATALALMAGAQPPGCRDIVTTDVLVCGHGRRDRCCGSLGTSLELAISNERPLAPHVRVGRTSHTGGHRFAPTAFILPEGTCWGYLDLPSLRQIVTRSGPTEDQLNRYRGCTGLASPAIQALERAALALVGWQLLGWSRTGEELGEGLVRLAATDSEGRSRHWQGRVVARRVLAVPQCGRPVSDEDKTEPELAVEGLIELPTRSARAT